MNTVKKGDKLESQIFNLFDTQINKDEFFFFKKDACKIFTKKGYYSRDRKKNIIFDVSIEVYLPGEKSYSLLFLIECKNYSHRVPVDDVEEFFAKAQQISGANIKGIVVSTNSFQEGTVEYSKSKGIGLLRYFHPSKLKWELTRSPSALISSNERIIGRHIAQRGIIDQDFESQYFDFYCYSNEEYTNSLTSFFRRLSVVNTEKEVLKNLPKIRQISTRNKAKVPFLHKQEIDDIAQKLHKKIDYQSGKVSLKEISLLLEKENGLQITYQAIDKDILGKLSFNPLEIVINSIGEKYLGRERFTLGHEIGHFILGHEQFMNGENCLETDLDIENKPEIEIKDIMNMEFQANYFASCLLLPRENFIYDFLIFVGQLGLSSRGYGVLYLDEQPCNLDSYHSVTNKLMNTYSVSKAVVKIRLKNLGLLTEKNNSLTSGSKKGLAEAGFDSQPSDFVQVCAKFKI